MKALLTATLSLEEKAYILPAYIGIEGEKAIDITKLRSQSGYMTLLSTRLNESSDIHEDMHHFFNGFPRVSHPMGILVTMAASISTFYPVPDRLDHRTELQIVANLISHIRTVAVFSYKKSIGEPLIYPSYDLKYVRNFLTMMFASPVRNYPFGDDIVRAIDMFLILHAVHEQNCSTSLVRTAGSSLANIYAVASAGIAALWGPIHRGADQAVIKMLDQIHAEGGDGTDFINQAKDKNSPSRLMGFGHRVDKNHNHQAVVLKKQCGKLLNKPGVSDPLFERARKLEKIALEDEYFIFRKPYPDVDFYSGLILRAVGIPTKMFTVLFVIGRMRGWLAHWRKCCMAILLTYIGQDKSLSGKRNAITYRLNSVDTYGLRASMISAIKLW